MSQLSNVNFENHQVKTNDSISEKEINGCDLEQSEITTYQTTAKVTTKITIPSTTKKVNLACMKILGHGVISSSNLVLLNLYQD